MVLPQRLPTLSGRRAIIVRYALIVLAVAMTLLEIGSFTFNSLYTFRDKPAVAKFGLVLASDDQGRPTIAQASGPAAAGGLAPDQHILALNGAPLKTNATMEDVAAGLRVSGDHATLLVADGHGKSSIHALSRLPTGVQSAQSQAMSPLVGGALARVTQLTAITLFLAMALLLFRERPTDPEAMLLAFAFLLLMDSFSDSTWVVWFGLSSSAALFFVNSLTFFGWYAILVGLCGFPDGRFTSLWSRIAVFAPTFYLIANVATGYAIFQNRSLDVLLDVPINLLCAGSAIVRYRQSPPGIERQQIKWVAFGAALSIIVTWLGAALQQPAVAAHFGESERLLLWLFRDIVITFSFPLGLLISILRYRLYDADRVITRSAAFTLLTISLVAIFAFTEKMVEIIGEERFGHSLGALAGGLGAAVAAVMLAPLHHRIMHWTEHRFRRNLVHFRNLAPTDLAYLRDTATPPHVAEALLDHCRHAFAAESGAVLLGGKPIARFGIEAGELKTWLGGWAHPALPIQIDRHGRPFPLRIALAVAGHPPIGWLLLGTRSDGSFYDRDERATIGAIADPAARALAVAQTRAREGATLRKAIAALREDIARMAEPAGSKAG